MADRKTDYVAIKVNGPAAGPVLVMRDVTRKEALDQAFKYVAIESGEQIELSPKSKWPKDDYEFDEAVSMLEMMCGIRCVRCGHILEVTQWQYAGVYKPKCTRC